MKRARNQMKKSFIFLSLLLLIGCYHIAHIPSGVPRFFYEDYDRVWKAAISTLDERGYVIAQIRKADGYIATEMKDNARWRIKITIRLSRENGSVKVKVNEFSEHLTSSDYWQEDASSGAFQQMILDKISSKLEKLER